MDAGHSVHSLRQSFIFLTGIALICTQGRGTVPERRIVLHPLLKLEIFAVRRGEGHRLEFYFALAEAYWHLKVLI